MLYGNGKLPLYSKYERCTPNHSHTKFTTAHGTAKFYSKFDSTSVDSFKILLIVFLQLQSFNKLELEMNPDFIFVILYILISEAVSTCDNT